MLSSLELRVPPLAVVVVVAVGMWLVSRAVPPGPFGPAPRAAIAALLVLAGATLIVAGIRQFRAARTTVNPLQPAQAASMVTSGVYGRTRNPMYLGMLCLLGAWAAWLGDAVSVLGLPLFVLYLNRFQIAPEERALAQRFGADFEAYASRVRRWL